MLQRLILAVALIAWLTGTAFAQLPIMPSVSLELENHRTREQIEKDKQIDNAYRSATKKIPDQSSANDPWASVRPAPATAPQSKPASQNKTVSQNKKQQ